MKEIKNDEYALGRSGPHIFSMEGKRLRIMNGLVRLNVEKTTFPGMSYRISAARLTIDILPNNRGVFFYVEEKTSKKLKGKNKVA